MSYDKDYFQVYLTSRVKDWYADTEGSDELLEEFQSVASTGFESKFLQETFQHQVDLDCWRIGEAIGECYLQDRQDIRIHYHNSRDAKNPKSSLPGADIVGFAEEEGETVFVFGEIKTSSDATIPPGVFYGPTGLKNQLEDLKMKLETRSTLVKWLGFKVSKLDENHKFRIDYKSALKTWLSSLGKRVRIIGVLIRDIIPSEKDLLARFNDLVKEIDSKMRLDLFAIYLPLGITSLKASMSGG
ncbi:MAG TPA: hypothetical protein VFF30_19995 [Nitrososphaerales archaeon]|nr:hypothetical protein [Nitrososphaerales archaeon]